MPEINDVRLVVEIKNKHPLELLELTKSLVSLANQFNSYTSDLNTSKEDREAKLYVKEIRTGSVILELIEVATIGVLPFIENINTLVSFAEYLRDSYQYFLGSPRGKPKEFSISDQRDLSQIINPIANDNGSQINVSVNVGEGATVYLAMGSLEANAIQNTIAREVAKSREPEPSDDIRHKVVFHWYQARNDLKSETGNKGIIEEISNKPMNVIFEDEKLKQPMLHGDNPFTTAFVVDATIIKINGRTSAYRITKLHETFNIEDQ